MNLNTIFAPDGILSQRLPRHESRSGQVLMADAVAETLERENGTVLVVEAETGIGKTLAYLIPAVLSRQRVVISTNTLNLQEQILKREIPFIRTYIDPELTALCVKGRQNYLCLHRWHQAASTAQAKLFAPADTLTAIGKWLSTTETGDRAELPWLADDSALWPEISATTGQCLGSNCPEEPSCFISRLRKKAAASRLLIVNHHLFFSDLALRATGFGEVLPRYETVIFDEAHHLEAVATKHFGTTFSQYQVVDLAHDLERLAAEHLLPDSRDRIITAARAMVAACERFATLFPRERGRFPLLELIRNEAEWESALEELGSHIRRMGDRIADSAHNDEPWPGLTARCEELLDRLNATATPFAEETGHYIRWGERRQRSVALISSPIDISGLLADSLYSRVRSCVFTSATLTTGNSFDYFLQRMGLAPETRTLSLASPFDYAGRTLLYVPGPRGGSHFPEPGNPAYQPMAQQEILDILLASRGRALVLFTSFAAMESSRIFLEQRLPFPMLVQGQAPKSLLLEMFQQNTDSVLLAVASFWEGVDVPGESLSCVIIDKLPFEVPSDPVIMARMNRIREQGGNPFFALQVPRAILALRQGVGRLLRSATDKGLLAILDARLFSKSYGRIFRASLPPSPLCRSMEEVRNFFDQHG